MGAAGLEPISISALQHWSYCPRQCALIHVEQVFADNVHTARGNAVHKLVDEPGAERAGTVRIERAMPLWSEVFGLIGKADLVEFDARGTPYPVEYKHGPRRKSVHDELQLAAQALCLEEMTGRPVSVGALFQFSSRRRREIAIDEALRLRVADAVLAVRRQIESGCLPPPLIDDARCRACSLIDLCQPSILGNRKRYHDLLTDLASPA